jgi:multidrug efflux system outer membrane protein
MKTINISMLLMTLLVLGACKVSKDVQTPQAALPVTFRNSTTTDTASIADIPWKNFFTDAELQKLIDSATGCQKH